MQIDYGLPRRMQAHLHAQFMRDGVLKHERKVDVIDEILCDVDRVSLKSDKIEIYNKAVDAAKECYSICGNVGTVDAILNSIRKVTERLGVPMPVGETDAEIMRRAVDKSWWNRNLTKEFKRRLEHASIKLGLTYQGSDSYISREVALFQRQQNKDNQKLLENTEVTNGEDIYKLSELAELGMANKAIRRAELMTRIRGFEEVATMLNHTALFFTITCPSKYHSVGGTNAKYNGATPRQAQKYLCKIWQRMRAAFNREGLRPYGFRIAEPHTDGCPHWHMLFFIEPKNAYRMEQIVKSYALKEDAGEWAQEENRMKLVRIDNSQGSAAGYITKYISKNIDGHGVGDHKSFKDGETYTVKKDLFGNEELMPSERVTYWSQVWGIRQFQQIGGAPIGVWRELRRVKEETIKDAPYEVQAAWAAAQKSCEPMFNNGQPVLDDEGKQITQASFKEYLIAQGGVDCGRNYRVRIAKECKVIEGKYATYEHAVPIGIYAQSEAEEIFKSVRFDWVRVGGSCLGGVAFDLPRTGVNNCTEPNGEKVAPPWMREKFDLKNKIFSSDVDEFIQNFRCRE